MFYPFTPTQGQQFTFYFEISNGPVELTNILNSNITIWKNAGASALATNAVTYIIDPNIASYVVGGSITLTATEMNTNVIQLGIFAKSGALVDIYTITTVLTQPVSVNTNLPNVSEFSSFDNPTMQEVLSVMWQAMTLEASKKKWSFATFLQKWTF